MLEAGNGVRCYVRARVARVRLLMRVLEPRWAPGRRLGG